MKAFDTLHFWTTFLAEQYGCRLFNWSVFTFISAQIGGEGIPYTPSSTGSYSKVERGSTAYISTKLTEKILFYSTFC